MYLHGLADATDGTSDPYPITYTPMDAPAVDPSLFDATPAVASDVSGNYYTIDSNAMPSASGSTSGWADLLTTALKTYGNIDNAKTAAKAQTTASQYQYASTLAARGYPTTGLNLPPGVTLPPGYSPLPVGMVASSSGLSTTAIVGIVGLGAALLYLIGS